MVMNKYNLYIAGAICTCCNQSYIKRRVAVMPELSVDFCECGGKLRYRKLGWIQYNRWMNMGAKYVEVENNERQVWKETLSYRA